MLVILWVLCDCVGYCVVFAWFSWLWVALQGTDVVFVAS